MKRIFAFSPRKTVGDRCWRKADLSLGRENKREMLKEIGRVCPNKEDITLYEGRQTSVIRLEATWPFRGSLHMVCR